LNRISQFQHAITNALHIYRSPAKFPAFLQAVAENCSTNILYTQLNVVLLIPYLQIKKNHILAKRKHFCKQGLMESTVKSFSVNVLNTFLTT